MQATAAQVRIRCHGRRRRRGRPLRAVLRGRRLEGGFRAGGLRGRLAAGFGFGAAFRLAAVLRFAGALPPGGRADFRRAGRRPVLLRDSPPLAMNPS